MIAGALIAAGAIALVAILWVAINGRKLQSNLGEYDGIRLLETDELGYGYHFKHGATGWTQWGYDSPKHALQAAKMQRAEFDRAVVKELERQFDHE